VQISVILLTSYFVLGFFAKYHSFFGVVTDLRKRDTLALEVGFTYYVRVKNICVYVE